MTTLSRLLQSKVVAIIRGAHPADVPLIAESLYKGGIRALEITLNSEAALEVIKNISGNMGAHLLAGAGTVLDAAAAKQAIDAGAQFIISPALDADTIRHTKECGAVSIPGAYTPTEIVAAWKAGADIVKVFPAASPQYISDLRGPLNHIPLMPTGGVNVANIAAFQKAGGVAFGIGSALVNGNERATKDYLARLTEKAQQFVAALEKE